MLPKYKNDSVRQDIPGDELHLTHHTNLDGHYSSNRRSSPSSLNTPHNPLYLPAYEEYPGIEIGSYRRVISHNHIARGLDTSPVNVSKFADDQRHSRAPKNRNELPSNSSYVDISFGQAFGRLSINPPHRRSSLSPQEGMPGSSRVRSPSPSPSTRRSSNELDEDQTEEYITTQTYPGMAEVTSPSSLVRNLGERLSDGSGDLTPSPKGASISWREDTDEAKTQRRNHRIRVDTPRYEVGKTYSFSTNNNTPHRDWDDTEQSDEMFGYGSSIVPSPHYPPHTHRDTHTVIREDMPVHIHPENIQHVPSYSTDVKATSPHRTPLHTPIHYSTSRSSDDTYSSPKGSFMDELRMSGQDIGPGWNRHPPPPKPTRQDREHAHSHAICQHPNHLVMAGHGERLHRNGVVDDSNLGHLPQQQSHLHPYSTQTQPQTQTHPPGVNISSRSPPPLPVVPFVDWHVSEAEDKAHLAEAEIALEAIRTEVGVKEEHAEKIYAMKESQGVHRPRVNRLEKAVDDDVNVEHDLALKTTTNPNIYKPLPSANPYLAPDDNAMPMNALIRPAPQPELKPAELPPPSPQSQFLCLGVGGSPVETRDFEDVMALGLEDNALTTGAAYDREGLHTSPPGTPAHNTSTQAPPNTKAYVEDDMLFMSSQMTHSHPKKAHAFQPKLDDSEDNGYKTYYSVPTDPNEPYHKEIRIVSPDSEKRNHHEEDRGGQWGDVASEGHELRRVREGDGYGSTDAMWRDPTLTIPLLATQNRTHMKAVWKGHATEDEEGKADERERRRHTKL